MSARCCSSLGCAAGPSCAARWLIGISVPGETSNSDPLMGLAARLAQRAPLRVLDGGNCFNAYIVALALRQQTTDVTAALERIRVSRAFTCYQMVTLLE